MSAPPPPLPWHRDLAEDKPAGAKGLDATSSIIDETAGYNPNAPVSGLRDPDPAQVHYAEALARRMDNEIDQPLVAAADRKGRVDVGARPERLYIIEYHPDGVIVLRPAVVVTKSELDHLLRAR